MVPTTGKCLLMGEVLFQEYPSNIHAKWSKEDQDHCIKWGQILQRKIYSEKTKKAFELMGT